MSNGNSTATLAAFKGRAKFIAEKLPGVPEAYLDSAIGLDPAKWDEEAEALRKRITADVAAYNAQSGGGEQGAGERQAGGGKWSFIKMPNERPQKNVSLADAKKRYPYLSDSAALQAANMVMPD